MNELDTIDTKVQLIKDTVCKGATADEFELFMYVCKRTGLDPLMKQIYSIPRGNSRTIQTSIDGFRLIAERSRCYSPGKEPSFNYKPDGSILSATAYVKKKGEDNTWHEVGATAFWDEYAILNGSFWKKMPHLMLAKCAESLALRRAFPAELSGIYTEDEMEQASKKDDPIEKVQTIEISTEELSNKDILQIALDLSKRMQFSNTDKLAEYLMRFKKSLAKVKDPVESFCSDKFVAGYEKWLAENPPAF